MIEVQVLSKVLKEQSLSLLYLNGVDEQYFPVYLEEYNFIVQHDVNYGNVPDEETFLAKFPQFPLVDVTESDKYLIDTLNEEYLYTKTVPVVKQLADILKTDAKEAVEFLQSQLPNLQLNNAKIGVDIISTAKVRAKAWEEAKLNPHSAFVTTGFPELDDWVGGFKLGDELAVVFSRTGEGKTWLLVKFVDSIRNAGKVIGLIEPEMSAEAIGYRFDTIHAQFSSSDLYRGNDIDGYIEYIEALQHEDIPLYVATPKDFNKKTTVSKLRAWIQLNHIDVLAIDGIAYLRDERREKGDNKTTSLTNISEDLMELSRELKVPIIVIVQSNREGKKDDDTPELENIRDSDGIAQNASLVFSLRQKDEDLEMSIRKNRNGKRGITLIYSWNINYGIFNFKNVREGRDNIQSDSMPKSTRRGHKVPEGVEKF